MKKLALLFIMSFLFLACEMFQTDIVAFLDKYSNTAAIEVVNFGENPTDSNGIEHLSSTGDKVILFTMRNPKSYNLTTNVMWVNSVLPDGFEGPIVGPEGSSASQCTLEQLSSDKSIIKLTIYESYLQQVDNEGGGYLRGTITLQEEETKRDFDSFNFTVAINSPPPTPQPVFVKNDVDSPARWHLAFDVATLSQRESLHGDISAITIDGVNYPISIAENGAITGLSSGFATDVPLANDGGSPLYSDSLGQAYMHSSGNTVYFDSGHDDNAGEITRTVQFLDSKGLVSSTASVSTKAQPILEFYVADGANGNGKSGNPFNNVQSAVDAIKAINDEESMYTIYIKDTITQQGSANSNGMVVIDSVTPLNITLQNWTGDTATINASGKDKRVLYISGAETNVSLSNIIVTGGYAKGVDGAPGYPGTKSNRDAGNGSDGSTGHGGGVYLLGGSLILSGESSITYNMAKGGNGGNGGNGLDGYHSGSGASEIDSRWGGWGGKGGNGANAYGGGIYIEGGSLKILDKASITSNNAIGGSKGGAGSGGDGYGSDDHGSHLANEGANGESRGAGDYDGSAYGGGAYKHSGTIVGIEKITQNSPDNTN